MGKKVVISTKVDLDTIATAFLLGVGDQDEIIVVKGNTAPESYLSDPDVICIEVGGSGQTELSNYDHHGENAPLQSACLQAWERLGRPERVKKLVEYVDLLDTQGIKRPDMKKENNRPRRFLSDVISGMLLTESDPVKQLILGIKILKEIVEKGYDPFSDIPGFDEYIKMKEENKERLSLAMQSTRWEVSKGGLRVAILETEYPGAIGALYNQGAQVAIVFNSNFKGVRKFTIGGNSIRVDSLLSVLNGIDPGWGGPSTGTIIGSPREGSKLSLEEVVKVVIDRL
jgi:hypothetical protein